MLTLVGAEGSEGHVWRCGCGCYGQLGHGDTVKKLVLTLVVAEGFRGRGAQIVMVAASGDHSVALGTEGRVWTWGWGKVGQLGHNNQENKLVPTQLADKALGRAAVVLVSAGGQAHSLRDGEGNAVDLGQRTIQPTGSRRQRAEAAPDTAGEGDIWRIARCDGILWNESHASADNRGPCVELWIWILRPTGPRRHSRQGSADARGGGGVHRGPDRHGGGRWKS